MKRAWALTSSIALSLNSEKKFYRFFWFYLLFLAVCAFFSAGWLQADEHARVLEPAHFLVHGYATLPWEFAKEKPIVSFFLAMLHAPVLFVSQYFHLDGTTDAFLLRLFSTLVCSTKLIAFYLLLPFITRVGSRRGVYLLLYAFGIFTPMLFVRTSQENWSSTAFLWACFLFFKLRAELERQKENPSESLASKVLLGIFIALSFTFRFQMGFSAAAIGLLCLATFGLRVAVQIGCGVLLGLLPMVVVDWKMTGVPFLPAFNYLMYGADGNEENMWGSSPWWWYFEGFVTKFYPPLSIALLVLLFRGVAKNRFLQVVILPFFVIHQWLAHKEARYYAPMLPFFYLAMYVGWEDLEQRYEKCRKFFDSPLRQIVGTSVFLFFAVGSAVMALAVQNGSPFLFEEMRKMVDRGDVKVKTWYTADSRSNVSLFYYKHPEAVPDKIALTHFINAVANRPLNQGPARFALYRINAKDLDEVERHCRVEFVSTSTLVRKVYSFAERFPGKHRLDAIVFCEQSPKFTDDEIKYSLPYGMPVTP